jgi:hypothetical protein
MMYALAVAGLFALILFSVVDKTSDQRAIAEQQPGDAGQLGNNLGSCLVTTLIVIALALMLWAIGWLAA